MSQEIFNQMLRAVLTNDEQDFHSIVNNAMWHHHFTEDQMIVILQKVEKWCRMKGLTPLLEHEETALVKLQSLFRLWYIRKKMYEKYLLYKRLSFLDCEQYALTAHKYYKLLRLH